MRAAAPAVIQQWGLRAGFITVLLKQSARSLLDTAGASSSPEARKTNSYRHPHPAPPRLSLSSGKTDFAESAPLPSSQTPVWCAGRGPAPRPPSPATSGAARVASEIRVLACLPCQHTGQPAVWVTSQTLSPNHLPPNIWEREGDAPCSPQHPHF